VFDRLCSACRVHLSPGLHLSVKRSKDVAAGAVLICALGAVVLGVLTFAPYVMRLLEAD